MADITELIAKATPKVDFSPIGNLPQDYFAGLDQRQKQDLRDVFKGGVPTNPDGSPNYAEMSRKLYQLGEVDKGTSLSNLDIQRQQLKLGQDLSANMGALENGGQQPPMKVPLVSPSTSRTLPTPAGGITTGQPGPQQGGGPIQAPQGGQGYRGPQSSSSVADIVQGAVKDPKVAGPMLAQIAQRLGVDPGAPLPPDVQQRVTQAIQRYAQGQGQQPQGAQAPQPQAMPPQGMPPGAPGQPQPGGPPGIPAPNRGAMPTGVDPEIQTQIARLTQIVSNPAVPEATRNAAKLRLEALQKQVEPTQGQKDYDLARRQGFSGSMQQFEEQKKLEAERAGQTGKDYATKYQAVVDQGNKAFQEIPQLEMVQKLMDDPNFYSGVGEKYNLAFKRIMTAIGGDPNTALPQEAFRKVLSGSILSGLSQLKGLGQIRVAEINLARNAAASTDNSPAANRMLVEISKRTYQRSADIAELAQNYNGGRLDAGFDRVVTEYNKQHPLFTDAEIKNPQLLAGKQSQAGVARPASKADYDGLAPGTKYIAPDGSERTKK